MMELPLKSGDRVRLTRTAIQMYGGALPLRPDQRGWVPEAQGGGSDGTLLFAGERPHKPGAAPRPYYVRWDNGAENSYRMEDLEAAEDPDEDSEPDPPNVIPFRRS